MVRMVLPDFPRCDRWKHFGVSSPQRLYDVAMRGMAAAAHDDVGVLGPACIMTPADGRRSYFQMGIVSQDYGEGVQGVEVFAISPLDKVRHLSHLLSSVVLSYGGLEENMFEARDINRPRTYKFIQSAAGEEPTLSLMMPSQAEHDQRQLHEFLINYAGQRVGEHGPREFDYSGHPKAFVTAVERGLFPSFSSVKRSGNMVYCGLSHTTPTNVVHPTLYLKLSLYRDWDFGPTPIAAAEFAGMQRVLDNHLPAIDPMLWTVDYTRASAAPRPQHNPMRSKDPSNNNQMTG